jgi:sigma-E factor negative regulatory protein RseC
MIEQQGKVVSVSNGRAYVRLGGTSGCSNCDAGKGCGAGVFGRWLKKSPVTLELENGVNARQGQPVVVGLPEALYLRLISRLYLFPLLAAIAGAAIGYYLSVFNGIGPASTDMLTLLSGFAGGAAIIWWNRNDSREFSESIIVHLLRIIEIHESGK